MNVIHHLPCLILSVGLLLSTHAARCEQRHEDGAQEFYAKYSPVTRESALTALWDTQPDIRGFAAFYLAREKFVDAKPAVEAALARESDQSAGIAIASSLVTLGDEAGVASLKTMCRSLELQIQRLNAAGALAREGRRDCAATILEIAQAPEDFAVAEMSVQILARIPDLSVAERQAAVRVASAALGDRSPEFLSGGLRSPGAAPLAKLRGAELRGVGADALAQLNDTSALPALRARLAIETDDAVRSRIDAAIQKLESDAQYVSGERK